MTAEIIHGDCLEVMRGMKSNTADAVITDPPYGLSFMGKGWDHGVPGETYWVEALRIAKPGSRILAFGGTRTFHRLAVAIEDAGWEIEDCLSWLYGSGFPKHKSKLKPAWEPVILARKPDRYATPLNIDECRISLNGERVTRDFARQRQTTGEGAAYGTFANNGAGIWENTSGRWPANVVLDEVAAEDIGESARYFYCAKASRSEREAGLSDSPKRNGGSNARGFTEDVARGQDRNRPVGNHHPTVKPVALMRWLIRLIAPPDGLVLDPFTGSGTTGIAATLEGRRFVGIEKEAEYVEIARKRIAHAQPSLGVA